MTDEKMLLNAIAQDILAVRQELASLRESFERAGLVNPSVRPSNAPPVATWQPPALTRLGDMVRIIAQANPMSAAALAAFDTERDVAVDPEVDVKVDQDRRTDQDFSTDRDPKKVDADPTKRDRGFLFWSDDDPTPRDAMLNPADKKRDKKADIAPTNTRDDANPTFPRPDTARDPDQVEG
jgi:hypothetical protein